MVGAGGRGEGRGLSLAEGGGGRPRYQLLDILRGIAILAMIVFHIGWDLFYFGLIATDVTTDLGWVIFQKSILASFLLLVGAGLVLAHGRAIRWRQFWRRFAILVLAALAVTAGTYWMFPDYFVFFGVLHAIALFSLLGLAFLRLPPLPVAALGAAVIAANFLFSDPVFSSRTLGWIGFWPVSPPTSDVVPIFPWFGVVLLGIAGMRLVLASPLATTLAGFHSDQPLARGVAFVGRWSLAVYLVHQPLIIGMLTLLMQLQSPAIAPPVPSRADGFLDSCISSCSAAGSPAGRCDRYCICALEQVEKDDLWAVVEAPSRTPDEELAFQTMTRLCTAMAAD